MSNPAIRVEQLSKAYRLGLKEAASETLGGTLVSWLTAPGRNLRNLRRLNTFDFSEPADDILWALRDVNFELQHGEVLGIVGRNGAGKSTLLKVLSRITDPTGGRVVMEGRVASLLEVGTGFHPELSGRENVYMNGTILGMTKKHIDERFDRIVEFSGVERFIDTPIKRYSSGMKVRLAFSVAAHLEPEILIIDEVLAVGDAEFQRRCLGKMSEVARGGRTVLFVSHQMEAVQRLCTRCIWIEAGKVVDDGLPEAIVPRYLGTQAEGAAERYRVSEPPPPGPVYLEEAVVVGADGREAQPVLYGEPVEVRMRWVCREAQPGAFYYLRVSDGQGRQLFSVNTRGRIEPVAGTTELRCRFDHSMFLPGSYSVTLGCFRRPNQFLHEADGALGIEVLNAAYPGVESNMAVRSLFDPRPTWHVG